MTPLLWGLGGLAAGAVAWLGLRSTLATPAFARTNFRGRTIPTAGGLVVVVALIAVEAVRAVWTGVTATSAAVVLAVVGFGLLGLLDDVGGDRTGTGGDRGFGGHLRALAAGRLTTGVVKLLGGGAVALVAASTARTSIVPGDLGGGVFTSEWGGPVVLFDAAAIALAANLGNLLDRAPGRSAKVAATALIALLATAVAAGVEAARLAPLAAVAGATLAVLVPDVRERLMLGDTGANVLGAVAGLAVVVLHGPGVTVGVALGLLALNVLSEVVSFSLVIDRVPPLRLLDRLGRQP